MEERIERQELFCHNCGKYVQFPIDLSLNGNHVLHCPNCGHEHCRVVKDGVITGERWDSRNGATWTISQTVTSASASSTFGGTDNSWRVMGSWGTAVVSSATIYTWTAS